MINGLKLAGVDVNRKVLADLAVNDMNAFRELRERCQSGACVRNSAMAVRKGSFPGGFFIR